MIKLDLKNVLSFDKNNQFAKLADEASVAYNTLVSKSGAGSSYLGWLRYPESFDKEEYARIKKAIEEIKKTSEVLVVIGIGGSYLGAKAVIEALKQYFKPSGVEIIFAGNTLSAEYLTSLKEYLKDKDFSINVISKSGTTTEPAVAFRVLKKLLEEKYGKDARKRIYATTDKAKGALRSMSEKSGYETFVVPDDIGGRYSWFTAVGLLPIGAAGIDLDALMQGAHLAMEDAYSEDKRGLFLDYAKARTLLSRLGFSVEVLVSYEPKLSYIAEWWKQLFGESEGKDGKGLFPASLTYSTDLHSMGQYIQEGQRIMFETVLDITKPAKNLVLEKEEQDLDELNYLAGKSLDEVNKMAMMGTIIAHVDGGVPNLKITLEKLDEKSLGYLLYFFMFSCGLACYMSGVNPFNQPGVESYKRNMFGLLEKPGYENLTSELKKRM